MDYILYTLNDYEINTVEQFVSQSILGIVRNITAYELLTYADENGYTNNDRIYSRYSEEEKQKFTVEYQSFSLTDIKQFTVLILPKKNLFIETVAISGENQIFPASTFDVFYSKKLVDLLNDVTYRTKTTYSTGVTNVIQTIFHNATVWIWCRALGEDGEIVDITPFIQNLTTNVDSNGGNFSLNISPIVCTQAQGNWVIDDINIVHFSDQYIQTIFIDNKNTYLHDLICSNDLIFIRFERLGNEDSRKVSNHIKDLIISKNRIPSLNQDEKIYDMLGMIDRCTKNTNFQSNDINVTITGRDYVKLLIDDGCFFYPLQFAQNTFINRQDQDKLIQRLAVNGSYILQSRNAYRSVSFSLQYLINHIANLGVVNNDLFSAYDNTELGRTYNYRIDDATINSSFRKTLSNGLWQIIKIVIDSDISDRRVADASITMPDGSLINQFRKVCQSPFVELFTDTYGDQFYIIARKPPFDGNSVVKVLNNIVAFNNESTIQGQNVIRQMSDIDIVYTITKDDTLSLDASDNTEDIYTLYELKPQGLFAGAGSEVSLAYIPLIYFQPYADIWGAKRLSVVSNYLPYSGVSGIDSNTSTNYLVRQAATDLKFLIDCYSYMPFTRNVTLVLNGDRTIKYGTWIRIEATGEIGYVTSVQNSLSINNSSIDRTTTVTLSRVMVEKYCKQTFDNDTISYFNIVDSKLVEQYIISSLEQSNSESERLGVQIRQNFAVNQKVFDFFIKRKQFN